MSQPNLVHGVHRTTDPQVNRCTAVMLLYAAGMDWSVRDAPLMLYCCCAAMMVRCDCPSRSVQLLSRRLVLAFLTSSCRTRCLTEFGLRFTLSPGDTFFYSSRQELPSDTFFLRGRQLAAKVFLTVLLYRMTLSCGIGTLSFAAASPSKSWVIFKSGSFAVYPSTSGCFFFRVLGGFSISQPTTAI